MIKGKLCLDCNRFYDWDSIENGRTPCCSHFWSRIIYLKESDLEKEDTTIK